jgi:serine/threonine protein kinase
MLLSAGDKLGPYEILAPLGAGGMGEVYRARDTAKRRRNSMKCYACEAAGPMLRVLRVQTAPALLRQATQFFGEGRLPVQHT